jgi:amino acid permease
VGQDGEARRALEAIERRVAERVALHRFHPDLATREEERRRPELVDLERHLSAWAHLVPGEDAARRELARLLAERHPKGLADAPGVCTCLGAAGAGRAGLFTRARLRLAAAARRAEAIPTVWLVALLVIGICLPQAIVGLPTAAATIGALPAVAVLAILGALMTLSMAAEGEAIVRSGPFRAGQAFLGRLTDEFLGPRASAVATLVAAARTALSVLGAYIGLSLTLASLTDVPRELWSTVTLVLLAAMLLRGGLKITVDAGAFVGLVSTVLVLAMAVLALPHVDGDALGHSDVGTDTLGPIVAMSLIYFIGNVYVIQVARRTLPRDPGGGDVVRGIALGTIALTVIGALWIVPVTGAVPAKDLTGEQGTSLGPLADVAGPAAAVLGTATTVLLLGLGIERAALALFKFTGERLGADRVRSRVLICSLPPLAVCAIGELLIAAGDVSFNDVMGLSGVISNVLVTGVVPMLLVAGARRRGELEPAWTIGQLGGTPVVTAVTLLYAALLVAFATLFYDGVGQRAAAGAAVVVLLVVVSLSRPARATGASP